MASEQMSSAFAFPAFRDPCTQIRLLDLHPGAWGAPLVGSLRVYNSDERPQYEAISYTWGDHYPLHSIEVNRQSLQIQTNCHYALSQVRLPYRHRLLWIDYICINQNDINEKGHQVQCMAEIFEEAYRVLVSLGPEADDSDRLVDNACSLLSTCEQAKSDGVAKGKVILYRPTSPAYKYLPQDIQETAYAWVDSLEDSELRTTFKAFVRFSTRPYWERLWVLPELQVAFDILFHCGRKRLDWEALKTMRDVFQDLRNKVNFQYRAATHDFGDVQKLGVHCLPLGQITSLAFSWQHTSLKPISWSFVNLDRLKCSDIRDRIYALLPTHKWPSKLPRLVVDYTRTPLELVCEAIKCCTSFEHVTHLLRALHIDIKDLEVTCLDTGTMQLCETISKFQTEDEEHNICTCDQQTVRKIFPVRFDGCIIGSLSRMPTAELQTSDEILLEEEPPTGNHDKSNEGLQFVRVVLNADMPEPGELIVLIPSGTMPGDILVRDSSMTTYDSFRGLVVRPTCTVVYEVIGPACLPSDHQMRSRYRNEIWNPVRTFAFRDDGKPPADIRLSVRDALNLGLQILEAEEQVQVLWAQTHPPNTPISPKNFTSYAIEWQTKLYARNLPCGACGGWFDATDLDRKWKY